MSSALDVELPSGRWSEIAAATALFAIDPQHLGGMVLRAGPGPERDRVVEWVRLLMPEGAPFARMPSHITDDRLLGGLALADTLRSGRVVIEQGLLAQVDRGVLVCSMAERIAQSVATQLCAALDHGEVTVQRDGFGATIRARLGLLLLDEGTDEESVAAPLLDRVALWVDLGGLRSVPSVELPRTQILAARARLADVTVDVEGVSALCEAAAALGIVSVRAPILAVHAARAHAALNGRAKVIDDDLAVAARLVLGPRATRAPSSEAEQEQQPEPEPEPDNQEQPESPEDDESQSDTEQESNEDDRSKAEPPLAEIVLEAAESGIVAGLLESLKQRNAPKRAPQSSGRSGAARLSTGGGRPAGVRAASGARGERLNVVETLRAAAPWQRLRRSASSQASTAVGASSRASTAVIVKREDFRVTRFVERTETTVIFCVDASGSAAMQRLAEAKGAVEQLLRDCYSRRDHVALIAFRGTGAELVLPPTRSLVRARRCLAGVAGGGATPLAAGLDAALAAAMDARKRGRSPLLIVMTDARANIARNGQAGGAEATSDAIASAQAVRSAGVPTLMLDTAPRPRDGARRLAEALDARYLPLPYLDSTRIARQVESLAKENREAHR